MRRSKVRRPITIKYQLKHYLVPIFFCMWIIIYEPCIRMVIFTNPSLICALLMFSYTILSPSTPIPNMKHSSSYNNAPLNLSEFGFSCVGYEVMALDSTHRFADLMDFSCPVQGEACYIIH